MTMLSPFEQPRLFEGLTIDWPPHVWPEPHIPSRALYRGDEMVNVLGYIGVGRFLVLRGSATTGIHRNNLTFLKEGT